MNTALVKVGLAAAAAAWGIKQLFDARGRRSALQQAFIKFHERIKHEQFGERELLRDRRELLLSRLGEVLPSDLRARAFDQGSYAMQTGIKPLSGEYDIDIGMEFNCERKRFTGPVEAKQLVRNALAQGSRRVAIRRSCVTVHYTGGRDQPDYHVDIAVYVKSPDGRLLLAKGKEHSAEAERRWELSEPERLTSLVRERFSGEEVAQFRRCVRFIKRWKQLHFKTQAPYSIALTIAAYHWFRPNAGRFLEEPDDLDALLGLVQRMLAEFHHGRLRIPLPVAPAVDLLERMTAKQMRDLEGRLKELESALERTREACDLDEALSTLSEQFFLPEHGC